MRRLTRLAVIVVMVLMLVTPAVAQVSQESATESNSGGIDLVAEVANQGAYAGQCTPATQFGNTVTPQSRLDASQYASELDDIEFGGSLNLLQYASKIDDVKGEDGSPMRFEPTQEVSCERSVEQATGAAGQGRTSAGTDAGRR